MTLEELIEQCRALPPMTPAEQRAQRIDWVYGNLACSTNHRVTREDVVRALDALDAAKPSCVYCRDFGAHGDELSGSEVYCTCSRGEALRLAEQRGA